MKVLHINTYDTGGAAKACIRLHQGLLKIRYNSKLLFCEKYRYISESSTIHEFQPQRTLWNKISEKSLRLLDQLKITSIFYKKRILENEITRIKSFLNDDDEYISVPASIWDVTSHPFFKEADVINLHWTGNFLDWESFFRKCNKPVVWTMHDMNPFLGVKHYHGGACSITEAIYTHSKNKHSLIKYEKKWLEFKKKQISKFSRLFFVGPSDWIIKEASQSELLKSYQFFKIPYGIPCETFRFINKNFSRHVLNLPLNKLLILFLADNLTNKRKGFIYLNKALENLKSIIDFELLIVGNRLNMKLNLNYAHYDFGRITEEILLAIIYSAADVTVIPSMEDNLPNVALESLCCGTPVIGFPVGGIPDVIQNNLNGLLCKEVSSESLVEALKVFVEKKQTFDSASISRLAHNKFNDINQAMEYSRLYQKILNS